MKPRTEKRLIETGNFPFDFLSALALKESWRKEVYRPVYHVHKWWAKRLGSVFRGILLGCLLSEDENLRGAFYKSQEFPDFSIFDPFMGSGTTVGEAHKLGCVALGMDINPVACESVRVAMGPMNKEKLLASFLALSKNIGKRIQDLYKSQDRSGRISDVLYFFWVKQATCLHCSKAVDLFSSYIIAKNAYPDRKPEVQIYCPDCGNIFVGLNHSDNAQCPSCKNKFNPHKGVVSGKNAQCPHCSKEFIIGEAIRKSKEPPHHRLYCKLLLNPEGKKEYLPVTSYDINAYKECSKMLKHQLKDGIINLPDSGLSDGYNTRQAISYNYNEWKDFFNDRQLLALSWLQNEIAEISDVSTRDSLLSLFSGTLEFNNLFASYKGEGTGAVRHMFSHHILKPERTPIEANIWGTPKSSGSFSNLFKSRLLRAIEYRKAPFEIAWNGHIKTINCGRPFSGKVEMQFPRKCSLNADSVYLSCGSSDKTGLPDKCIDYIVTDPPFFDNVNYSELADFFFAWQKLYPRGFIQKISSTRNDKEVQDRNADSFAGKLQSVFEECRRIMKDEGFLVFTYHHSRTEGWTSVARAICGAGFSIINVFPVKSEMSVAMPKVQAKEPIQLDVIFVCRKRELDDRLRHNSEEAFSECVEKSTTMFNVLKKVGLKLSLNDARVILYSQFLSSLGPLKNTKDITDALSSQSVFLDNIAEKLIP